MSRCSTSPNCSGARCQTERVSILFGGGRPDRARDPELAEATRRRERAFARDIGDEQTLARGDEPRYRRPRLWLLVFIAVVAVVAGIEVDRHKGGGPTIARSCVQPGLVLAHGSIGAGDDVDWSATGPPSGRYVLVADGRPLRADSDGRVSVRGGKALSPFFTMSDCLAHSTFTAPSAAGRHEIRLFHRTESGLALVASKRLSVTG